MKKKMLSIVMALTMTASLFAGCGDTAASTSEATSAETKTETSAEATSEAVDLSALPEAITAGVTVAGDPAYYANTDLTDAYTVNMYLIGDTPNDWDDVLALINDYLKPYNTELAVTFMSWSDYQTMYSLTLAGGADVDIIFTAPWCYMYTEAAKGSFYTLDSDFVAKYMPLTNKYQASESWDETTVAGKTIAVSANTMDTNGKIVAIRQDIADKYGISELTSWDDYKNFMLTVAENETPSTGIYAMAAAGENKELWDVYRQQYDTFYALESDWIKLIYQYDGDAPTSDEIGLAFETDYFKEFCYDMKELADAGAWSRGALTNTITDDDAFGALQSASIAWNTSVFTYVEQAEATDGVECQAYFLTPDHLVSAEAYSNNDMAIAAGSKNPERAAMVLDLLKCDTYLNHLILLGIEDVHYTIDDEGHYTETEKAADYAAMSISASWAVKNGDVSEAGADPREEAIIAAEAPCKTACPTVAFVFDDSSITNEVAAVDSVLTEYVPMLTLGLVSDVDATIQEMLDKSYASGLQTILDEYRSQYDAWLATR